MLSIVIPVFNQASYSAQCLSALASTAGNTDSYEIVIIDNNSSDETPQIVAKFSKQLPIVYIRNKVNLGFTLGSNLGAERSKGDTLVFLNNDTMPQPGWRERLEQSLAGAGIVGPKLLYPGSLEVNHAGYVFSPKMGGFYPIYHRYAGNFRGVSKSRTFQALLGACLMMKRETFEKLNGFAEIGLEDIDLCLRTRELGLDVLYVPEAVVYHFGSVTQNNSALDSIPIYSNQQFSDRWKSRGLIWDDYKYYIADSVLAATSEESANLSFAELQKGLEANLKGEWQLYLKSIEKSLQLYPGNIDALTERFLIFSEKSDITNAKLVCCELIEQGANFGEALSFVANVYSKLGLKSECEQIVEKISQLDGCSSETREFARQLINY